METQTAKKSTKLGLISIISLIGAIIALSWSAKNRQNQTILQAPSETAVEVENQATQEFQDIYTQEQLAAAELLKTDFDKNASFFSARYNGCFKAKNSIVCESLYPEKKIKSHKSKASDWREAQLKINKLSPKGRKSVRQNLIKSKKCASSSYLAALAFKTEEELPNKEALKDALALYEKAFVCAKNDNYELRGLYRWGLLSLWAKQNDSARVAFQTYLKHSEDVNLKSRAQYWLNSMQQQDGQNISSQDLKEQWLEFPLSHHLNTQVVNQNMEPVDFVVQNTKIRTLNRSESSQKINNSLALFELLQNAGYQELALRTLEFLDFKLLATLEPEVQLHVALLLNEHDPKQHNMFMVLSRLFQNHPRYKNLETLKVFYPTPFKDLILSSKLNQDPALIIALIRQESSFNTKTVSPVGARGLMQIMPNTAKEMNKRITEKDLLNPDKNIPLGVRYLRALLREFKGDEHKALAAYNAGAGNVKKWVKRYPVQDPLLFADLIPFDETREYITSILRNRYWYSRLYPEFALDEKIASAAYSRSTSTQSN
ncbi:MAG: lytic transglycosylase domain-containing protein [Bdellovibrionia bacterium]